MFPKKKKSDFPQITSHFALTQSFMEVQYHSRSLDWDIEYSKECVDPNTRHRRT